MNEIDPLYDQRTHRRVQLEQWARVNFDGYWHGCPVLDVSGGGACLALNLHPPVGSHVLFQMRGIGVVRASVVHCSPGAFSVQFFAQDYDQEAFVDILTLPANQALLKSLRRRGGSDAPAIETPQEPLDASLPPFDPDEAKISGARLLQPLASDDPAGQRPDDGPTAGDDDPEAGIESARRHPMRARLAGNG